MALPATLVRMRGLLLVGVLCGMAGNAEADSPDIFNVQNKDTVIVFSECQMSVGTIDEMEVNSFEPTKITSVCRFDGKRNGLDCQNYSQEGTLKPLERQFLKKRAKADKPFWGGIFKNEELYLRLTVVPDSGQGLAHAVWTFATNGFFGARVCTGSVELGTVFNQRIAKTR